MSIRDHSEAQEVYPARHRHPALRFTVKWCPVCGAVKEHDGGERYCRSTDACVTTHGARLTATTMQTVEVATREGWERA